jgi:imidazolonepropionase-like amidohydrolase
MPFVLRPRWVLDGRSSEPINDVEVAVSGDRILHTGPVRAPAGEFPADATVIDLDDCTLLPSFVDAHAHFYKDHESLADLEAKGQALMAAGFLTVRDLGSPGSALLEYRRAVASEPSGGPRLLACGRIISAPSRGAERFGKLYRVAEGPDVFRDAVRAEAARGVDVIKVMVTGALNVPDEPIDPPQLTAAELHAVVDEARRHELPVAAHAEGVNGIRLAVDCGVHTIEHGEEASQDPRLLEAMAATGIVLVPTLALFDMVVDSGEDAAVRERARRLRDMAVRTVRMAGDAGVVLACGPDVLSNLGPTRAGPTELRLLAQAGVSGPELVRAATSDGSFACRLDAGAISGGAHADLVAVRGDVSRDPGALWRDPPVLVMRAGQLVELPAGGARAGSS